MSPDPRPAPRRRVYLDHASATPVRPAALEATVRALRDHVGDPGRLHAEGTAARVALETAREQVAALVGARPREVVFTASGTEATNAAIYGAVARAGGHGHVVTTAVEHSAVLDACRRAPVALTVVGVDRRGRVEPDAVLDALRDDTVLVSVQSANHEVGTRQPIAEIVRRLRARGVLVHVDARTSAGHEPWSFAEVGADLASVSGHGFGGPPGTGALLVRRGVRVPPFVVGGAQERARRAGLENVAAAVGLGAAAAELVGTLDAEATAQRALVDAAARVVDVVPGIARYGDPEDRVPQILCLGVEGVEAEPVLLALDRRGVAIHSGSSCSSETLEPSPVLAAMGVDAEHALRISVGWTSVAEDAAELVAALDEVVGALRALRAGAGR